MKRSSARAAIALGAVVLSPVLLAGPAFADDVIEEEPPGGATCAPEIPATDCEAETPATPKPTPSKTVQPATIPVTGGKPSTGGASATPTLARTGATQGYVVGAGAGLLLLGTGLVAAGRRRTA